MDKTDRLYFLYDARAMADAGTDDAIEIIGGGDTIEQAHREAKEYGVDCAIYSYRIFENELVDERWEQDYYA
jgi:hypothetical protein